MHIPEILGGDGGWLGLAVAVIAVAGVLWKPVRALLRVFRRLNEFMDDWQGRPERRDPNTGEVIQSGRPSAPALLERMRHQVENSHRTNLRDDVDEVARRIENVADMVQGVRNDLTVHVAIAKDAEKRQAETAREVAKLAARWGDTRPAPPPRSPKPRR